MFTLADSFMHFYECYAWLENRGTKTKNTQHTSTIVLFFSHIILSSFTLFHVVSYPFPPRGACYFNFPMFFSPGASLDQFTKSPSWEQYNLAKGTIFIIMRFRAEVTGFTGRIFAKLEKAQFRVNPNPYSFRFRFQRRPYPLSGPAQIQNVFLKPSIHHPFPKLYIPSHF